MQKLYLFLFAITSCIQATAQIPKNSSLLGGHLSFNRTHTEIDNTGEDKTNLLIIGISFGRAFKENSVLGLNFGYRHSQGKTDLVSGEHISGKENGYELGPFYRTYKALGKKFNLFGQADVMVASSVGETDYESSNLDHETKTIIGSAALTPGASYQVFKNLHLELLVPNVLSFGYQALKLDYEDPNLNDTETSSLFFNTRFSNYSLLGSVAFGFRFVF